MEQPRVGPSSRRISTPIETEFVSRFEALLNVASEALKKSPLKGKLPARNVKYYEIMSDWSYRIHERQGADLNRVVPPLAMLLEDTIEWRNLFGLLNESDPFAKYFDTMYGSSPMRTRLVPHELLQQLLQYYLEHKKCVNRDRRLIRGMYQQLYRYFSRGTIRMEYFQYILGLIPPAKAARFGPIILSRIDPSDATRLVNSDSEFRYLTMDSRHGHLDRVRAVLALVVQDNVRFGDELDHASHAARIHSFEDAVNCLRLLCAQRLVESQMSINTWFLPFKPLTMGHGETPTIGIVQPSELTRQEVRIARTCATQIGHAKKRFPSLGIALDRLHSSDLRNTPADAVIDLCVAFEVIAARCLRKGATKDRMPQDQVCLYVAHFIRKSPAEKKLVFDTVRACFHLRNAIIHQGDRASPEKGTLQQGRLLLKEALVKAVLESHIARQRSLSELLFG